MSEIEFYNLGHILYGFCPSSPGEKLTKNFHLTQVSILPIFNIKMGNGGADTNLLLLRLWFRMQVFQHNLSTIVGSEARKYVVFIAQKATPQVLPILECERASDLDKEVWNVSKCVLREQSHQI